MHVTMQYLETVFDFTLLAYLLNQNSHCALCSLNFECPHLGYGFLSIILVLKNAFWVLESPRKVLEFCTLSLLRTLLFATLSSTQHTQRMQYSKDAQYFKL